MIEDWKPLTMLASSADLKEFKLHTVYSGISEQTNPLQLVGQAAELKLGPILSQHPSPKAISKAISKDNQWV